MMSVRKRADFSRRECVKYGFKISDFMRLFFFVLFCLLVSTPKIKRI